MKSYNAAQPIKLTSGKVELPERIIKRFIRSLNDKSEITSPITIPRGASFNFEGKLPKKLEVLVDESPAKINLLTIAQFKGAPKFKDKIKK